MRLRDSLLRLIPQSAQPMRRLRLGIIAFAAVVTAGYGIDAYHHVIGERDGIVADARRRALTVAIGLEEHLARTLQAVELVLDNGVERIEWAIGGGDADIPAIIATLRTLHGRAPQLHNLLVTDADGAVVATARPASSVSQDVSHREFFRGHANGTSRETLHSPVIQSRVSGDILVPLSRRLEHPDGRFAGVLSAGLDTRYIEDFYARLRGPQSLTLSAYATDGQVIARVPRLAEESDRDASGSPLFQDLLPRSPSGIMRVEADAYGPARFVGWHRAASLPYVLAVSIPEDSLLAGWRDSAAGAGKQAILAFVTVAGLAGFLLLMTYRWEELVRQLGESEERARTHAAYLEDAIEAIPDGFVLYDAEDRFVTCNSRFRDLRSSNPLSYQPGARFEDIFRQAIALGDVPVPADQDREAWIQARLLARRNPAGHNRMSYSRGRWLRVSERRMRDGGIVAIHADITALKRTQAESDAARRQMADWAEASNDWFWESDPDHRLIFMSDRNTPAGTTTTSSLGKRVRDLATDTESEPEKWARHLEDLGHRRPFRDFTFHIEDRHGQVRVLSANGKPIFAADGGFTGYRGTARDVTEEVTAKENAARARNLLAEALEATEEGFAIWDAEDRLVLCNSPFRRQHGVLADLYQPGTRFEDIVRQAVAQGHVPNARGREEELIAERLAAHRNPKGMFESRLASGRWKRVKEYRMADGGVVGVHIDVTDQKMREFELGELARRNALFFTAMSRATSAMVIADARMTGEPIIFVNPAFTAMTGYGEHEAVGQGVDFIYDVAEDPAAADVIRKALSAHQPIEVQVPARHRDGSRLYLDLRAGPVAGPDGTVTHFIVVQDDVTKRVEAEAQRAELENQLRHSQKIEALGTLAGGIAHDVNNTLVPIVALSKLALKTLPQEGTGRETMQTILDASYRIRDLVAEILAFSRKELPRAEPVELQSVVSKAVRLLSATLGPNVVIGQELAETPVIVSADENQLVQVLMNLCTNAAHAIGAGPGRVTITLDTLAIGESVKTRSGMPSGLYARLTVTDTGCGMESRVMQRIFEPFYTTTGVGEGTGLGLSVAHGIIASHRGRITVDSIVGQGSTFTVLLPVAGDGADETSEQPHFAHA